MHVATRMSDGIRTMCCFLEGDNGKKQRRIDPFHRCGFTVCSVSLEQRVLRIRSVMAKQPLRRVGSASQAIPQGLGASPYLDMRPAQPDSDRTITQARRDRIRLRTASWAFTTRRVPQGAATTILRQNGRPEAGDLVLATVDALGHHGDLQTVSGRRRHLFVGDEIVVAYGNRYAS